MDTLTSPDSPTKSSDDWQKLQVATLQEIARRNPDSLLDWALAHRFFNGRPMRMIPAMHDIYRDTHPNLVVQKAAQVFISEYLINSALWVADTGQGGRGNALFVMPTQSQVNDFSQSRVDRAIAESPYLQERLYPSPPLKQGPARVGLKRVGMGYINFRGSDNQRQLTSVDADAVFLDEFDLMADGVLARAQKRLASSRLGWLRIASTPRFPEAGVNSIFLQSDQRYYFLRCPACKREQKLEWPINVDRKNLRIVCRRAKCRSPLDLWAPGRWQAMAPGNVEVRGYHINRLYSPLANLGQIIFESESTSPSEQQEFQTSVLGETFLPPGGKLTLDGLDGCRRDYELPESSIGRCYMGVDVGLVLNVVIREGLDDQGSRGRLMFVGELKNFEDLNALIQRYNVVGGVIDAQPESRGAYNFCRSRRDFAVCRYTRSEPGIDPLTDHGVLVLNTSRTWILEEMFAAFTEQRGELPSGARYLGGRFRDGFGEYYRQLMALNRVLDQDSNGNWVSSYEDQGKADHYAHAEAYCRLAMRWYRPRPQRIARASSSIHR